MLVELTIRNFAVITETRIEFGRGLNALTGETGAGKSIVLDALGAVLGERTSPQVIRAGADRAYVEAIFEISDSATEIELVPLLNDIGIGVEPGDPLILSRDIAPKRSTARINSRAVTAGDLTSVGELLVDIHGQSDHLSLLRPSAQLDMLDSFAGTMPLRAKTKSIYETWRSIQRRIEAFDLEQRENAQRIDFLELQLREIESVSPLPGEYDELDAERQRLTHAVRLLSLAEQTRAALEGSDGMDRVEIGALDRLREAEAALAEMAKLDTTSEHFVSQLRDALFALDELSTDLRDYLDLLEVDPDRLDLVNQRIQDIRELTRKYGSTVDEVLEYAGSIQAELESLRESATDIDDLRSQEHRVATELADVALQLSDARSRAGSELAARVEATIAELNMGAAKFEVSVRRQPDESGLRVGDEHVAVDGTGIDTVAFLLAANPGSAPQPLASVASGGETARLMLALKSILSQADATPTLVFDEIDVGIGGRSGQIVGEKLWSLTGEHQVIVISHLPQVAAFADRHTAMVKQDVDSATSTTAEPLNEEESLDEIATMFDGKPVSPGARASARALLQRVNRWKSEHQEPASADTAG
ncbi:DNA repair protein RecN [soil metagenome]